MGFKSITGIVWTNLELEGLVEDEDSCVTLERVQKHLGLHPFHLTNLNAALNEILDSKLNFYDPALEGLVIAYRNPKLLSTLGDVMYDTCYVHVDIEADFYVFRPKIGQSLKGFVNKKGTNHIGILVHKAFNVSVPKPEFEEENIEELENWPGNKVRVGQEIRFTLDEINYNSRLPYIRGKLYEEEYLNGCKLFNEQIAATCESEFQDITRNTFNKDSSSKIKCKENKHVMFNSDSEDEVDVKNVPVEDVKKVKCESEANKETVKSPSRKRKNESMRTSESQSESSQHDSQLDESNSGNPPKKRKKKIKNNVSPNDTEDERKQKSLINKLSENMAPGSSSNTENEVSNTPIKKHKKKKKKKIDNDTEDEKPDKSIIKGSQSLIDNSIDKESDEPVIKKSKKRRKDSMDCIDTEDEKHFKSNINKSLKQKLLQSDVNETKSESESPKIPTKKQKKEHIENYIPNDTEDEKHYKSVIKKSLSQKLLPDDTNGVESELELPKLKTKKHKKRTVENDDIVDTEDEKKYKASLRKISESHSIDNGEDGFQIPRTPPKKRKKKHSESSEINDDSEYERKTKKSLIKNLTQNTESEELNNLENQSKLSKKKKKVAMDNCELLDTEDELAYKSSLKTLVENLQSENQDMDSEFKVPKKKKHKKKHESLKSGIESELDPLSIKVKLEPESETEESRKEKDNKKSNK